MTAGLLYSIGGSQSETVSQLGGVKNISTNISTKKISLNYYSDKL